MPRKTISLGRFGEFEYLPLGEWNHARKGEHVVRWVKRGSPYTPHPSTRTYDLGPLGEAEILPLRHWSEVDKNYPVIRLSKRR